MTESNDVKMLSFVSLVTVRFAQPGKNCISRKKTLSRMVPENKQQQCKYVNDT